MLWSGCLFPTSFASQELTDPMYNENEDFIPTHQGPVKRSAIPVSPISVIDNGPEVTITFYQAYTNCKILVYKEDEVISSSTYDTIPSGYTETLSFKASGSYEIDILAEGKTVYSTELSIE
jgi:hypothetical protein